MDQFTLVELSPELLDAARERLRGFGLLDRATLVLGDWRDGAPDEVDLVYFDHALHHLSDIDNVIEDMARRLRPGGVFLMNDFVGPTYNQFSPEVADYAEHVRSLLPASIFRAGAPREVCRSSVEEWIQSDPSEACDSGSILPAIARHMPGAEIIPTGGLVYYLACREVFHHLHDDPDGDEAIVRLLFELDRVLVRSKPELTCYALAFWRKGSANQPATDWRDMIRWPDWGIPI